MSRLCDTTDGAKEIASNLDTDQEEGVRQVSQCIIELMPEGNSARKQEKKNQLFNAIDANDKKGVGADLILDRDAAGNVKNFEVHGNSKK